MAAKVSNYVHDDVAFAILSKLPLKSLRRFECIRKSWSLLFDNPHFMTVYRKNFLSKCPSYDDEASFLIYIHSGKRLYSLFGERFENMVRLDRPNIVSRQYTNLTFLGFSSVNGILCFKEGTGNKLVLWNPTTKEFNAIPPSPFESFSPPAELNFKATIEFHANPILHGFGYNCVRDDYKLIRHTCIDYCFPDSSDLLIGMPSDRDLSLLQDKSLNPFWEIYSLRSNSWNKLDVDMPRCRQYYYGFVTNGVHTDGVCHWLHLDSENDYVGACLVSFNLSNVVFTNTLIPSFIGANWAKLMVLNGSIALITYHEKITTFNISVLGELGVQESWIKLFIVRPLPCVHIPIGVGKKGEIFIRKKDDELAWIDLNTNTIEELGFKGNRYNWRDQIVTYTKSLLPIGRISH